MRFATGSAVDLLWPTWMRVSSWVGMFALGALSFTAQMLAQAAEPGDIVIGQIVSRAEGLADAGREIGIGAQACLQSVNATGGRARPQFAPDCAR